MKSGHLVGITPAHPHPDFSLLRDLGVQWVRQGYPYPFADANGTLSDAFKRADEIIDRYKQEGFQVLCSFPGPGSMRYSPEQGKTVYHRTMPDDLGHPSEPQYQAFLFEAAAFLGDYTKTKIMWWQVANEPDIDIFYGPLTEKENVGFLLSAARGIMKGNPEARCGINLGYLSDYSRRLIHALYRMDDSPFFYLGLDGYMGSWQGGGPETWLPYIQETAALSGKPIIINEWGFSSLQWGEKHTDIERKQYYNQDVCRQKYWHNTWGKGHTPEEQARYIRECVAIFANHPSVIGNFFFRWSDTESCWQCGEADCPAECAWGCTDTKQRPKPAYYALQGCIQTFF